MTDNKPDFKQERERMVSAQVEFRGVRDECVLAAMRKIPRHLFVPARQRIHAYRDEPLSIGEGQTISQPYIVAYMTEALALKSTDRVLEIGTGSGYQTAVLAEIVREVNTVEVLERLSRKAQALLHELGYGNISFHIGDGNSGWPNHHPYDAVLVTAAPEKIPPALQHQLKPEGRLIAPVGVLHQELVLVRREGDRFISKSLLPVRFVPLVKVH